MADWTDIADATLAEEKPIPQTVIRQLRDNSQYNKDRAESWAAFRAYVATASGENPATWTEDFDSGNNFSAGSYTVPETGVYVLFVQMKHDITAAGTMVSVQIKNGATVLADSFAFGSSDGGGNDYLFTKCLTIEKLTAEDVITIVINNEAAGTPTLLTGHEHSYFYGYKLPGSEAF